MVDPSSPNGYIIPKKSPAPKQETAKSEWWNKEPYSYMSPIAGPVNPDLPMHIRGWDIPAIIRRAKEEERERYAKIIQNQIGLLDRLDGVYIQPPAKDVLKSILSALTSETEV